MDFDVLTIINLHVYIVLIYSEEKQLSNFASVMCWLKISACLFEIILRRNLLKDERQNLNILSNLVFTISVCHAKYIASEIIYTMKLILSTIVLLLEKMENMIQRMT